MVFSSTHSLPAQSLSFGGRVGKSNCAMCSGRLAIR
jgi:hypothetical protein